MPIRACAKVNKGKLGKIMYSTPKNNNPCASKNPNTNRGEAFGDNWIFTEPSILFPHLSLNTPVFKDKFCVVLLAYYRGTVQRVSGIRVPSGASLMSGGFGSWQGLPGTESAFSRS